jgi:hypothetical protein
MSVLGDLQRKRNLAGEEGFEPSHVGIKIRCLNQLGDSPALDDALLRYPKMQCLLASLGPTQ